MFGILLAASLAGCASLATPNPTNAQIDPAVRGSPSDYFWTYARADPHYPGARLPVGGHGLRLTSRSLLTCRHIYPMGTIEFADGSAEIVGFENIGGAFGGAGSDWVLLQISCDLPPRPVVFAESLPRPGDNGYLIYYDLQKPSIEPTRHIAAFRVIETPAWARHGAEPGIAIVITSDHKVRPGMSGAPAYIIDDDEEPQFIGLLVGRQIGLRSDGSRVGVTKITPIAERDVMLRENPAPTEIKDP